jgi:hypothetical protein
MWVLEDKLCSDSILFHFDICFFIHFNFFLSFFLVDLGWGDIVNWMVV